MDLIENHKAFFLPPPPPPPHVVCKEKTVECHNDHISLANHRLKSWHISHEQRHKLRKHIYFISRPVKRRYYRRYFNGNSLLG